MYGRENNDDLLTSLKREHSFFSSLLSELYSQFFDSLFSATIWELNIFCQELKSAINHLSSSKACVCFNPILFIRCNLNFPHKTLVCHSSYFEKVSHCISLLTADHYRIVMCR